MLRPIADAAPDDRETAWLISRAELQLGRVEPAASWLERAHGFGRDGTSPEPSPYVGARRCASCHPTAAHGHEESPHARTLYAGNDLAEVPLPDRPVPDPREPRIQHTFTREAPDRIRLETTDDRGQVARAVVAYALGSGKHGITMVTRDEPGGTPRQLRVSYYADGPTWGPTKGFDSAPRSVNQFIGMPLSEKALKTCLECHSTWFGAAMADPSRSSGPESLDHGIGCEHCHGPGLNHVKAIDLAYPDSAIADTPKTPPKQLLESCAECHSSTGMVSMSDPEFARFQGTTLKFSRCYKASDGAIHCATCHDPHRELDHDIPRYETRCLDCHASKSGSTTCPVNAASGCINCHMPKVADPGFQARFTNHHIRVHQNPE